MKGVKKLRVLLRRVIHKESETERKKAERFTTNKVFEGEKKVSITLYPIPDFIERKCSCGKEGIGMDENMIVRCVGCIDEVVGKSKLIEYKVLVIPSIAQAVKGNAFEWQVQGNEQWYKVKGTNIIPDSKQSLPKEEIQKRFLEMMGKVLADDPQLVDADYSKDDKRLIVYV
jgi:hypothetical protein